MHALRSTALALVFSFACATPALAWGASGHRFISGAAAAALPDSVPGFVRTPDARSEIERLGPEPDRIRNSGKEIDSDLDPGHFLDLGDDLTVGGAFALDALPATRALYDSALRDAHTSASVQGYLPYNIIEGWQLVRKDFAIWRIDAAGERTAGDPATRAFFTSDRLLREALTLRDIGYWSHFVADASQPMHASVHYNGWGDYPNPKGYTNAKTTHWNFEGPFVHQHANLAAVLARVGPYRACGCSIEAQTIAYLTATNAQLVPFYDLELHGAFANATPAGVDFTLVRLAAGATMLRDMIGEAWEESARWNVGYPPVKVEDLESGKIPVTRALLDGSE